MAAQIVFENYLQNVLLIVDLPVQNAIIAQGINDFDALRTLKDEDMRQLCINLHLPGATIINPQAGHGQPP
jgi:hypothetical protein